MTTTLRLIALACFFTSYISIHAQQTYELYSYEITITGTSSVKDWQSSVNKVSADVSLDGNNLNRLDINYLCLTIPVKGIISRRGETMDNRTYKALKSETYPNIKYQFKKLLKQNRKGLTALGDLTIAGVTKEVELMVERDQFDDLLSFSGETSFLMSEYGVEPPSALLGSLRTGDEVTIYFTITLSPKKKNTEIF